MRLSLDLEFFAPKNPEFHYFSSLCVFICSLKEFGLEHWAWIRGDKRSNERFKQFVPFFQVVSQEKLQYMISVMYFVALCY